MNFGPLEIGIIVAIILLLFGARKLPDLGKGLGGGLREFKEGITGESERKQDGSSSSRGGDLGQRSDEDE